MKSKLFKERGQALIIIALAAIGLFGITGLAIDGSIKFSDRRHAQNAADAAALAGALGKGAGDDETTWKYKAVKIAYENGYDSVSPSENVDVYSCNESGATCGAYAGNSYYVQVIITSDVDTYFASILGIEQTHNTVQAVALAQKGGVLGDGAMLISYDPDPNCSTGGTGGYSVSVGGSSSVDLNGGGIFLNSDEVCGFKIPNCADLNIYGGSINSAGNNIDLGSCTFDPPVTSKINQNPIAIPDDVYFPDVPPECNIAASVTYLGVDSSDGRGEWLIKPGYYELFPPTNLVSNKQHIYMASGVYCIDPGGSSHDFDLSWSPVDFVSLNGSVDPSENKYHAYNPDGVTLYIKSGGGFSINANNPTYLDGATSGDYQGYLIVLEGTHTSIESCSISGGADVDINGMIFAPYCNITVNGGSSSTAKINAQLLGWDLKIDGGAGINFKYDPKYAVHLKRRVGLMR